MRDRLLRKTLRERFLVTLKSGNAFDGLLDEWDRDHLVFVDANAYTTTNGQPTLVAVQGQLFLRRDEVAYCQVLPR